MSTTGAEAESVAGNGASPACGCGGGALVGAGPLLGTGPVP